MAPSGIPEFPRIGWTRVKIVISSFICDVVGAVAVKTRMITPLPVAAATLTPAFRTNSRIFFALLFSASYPRFPRFRILANVLPSTVAGRMLGKASVSRPCPSVSTHYGVYGSYHLLKSPSPFRIPFRDKCRC
ncbi:hypothetical protein M406DRAFT_71408 [Cryphonectria parasitica EP155]|uniref:Uncharacterized protein n=1 Tax=Cryphonectria parasitica (strain ATCC 38755 / EP155) TaxID=660469 RepID=A0A9P4Y8F4_CRYP1|nr:uncharacterized protein M406DRAFT_71408 [Cryphonectria parasitica EP155]KAF3768370.1 hypothetical protein M406DRAFT_71408 [Cryphonectria parasitica EP155]